MRLGWPIILANLSQMALGIIDNAMVGAIHSSQLAAASFVLNLIVIPLVFGFGISMAVSPLVAAAEGEDDVDRPIKILYNAIWIVVVLMLVLSVIMTFVTNYMHLMGQDDIVVQHARPYYLWMVWSLLPMTLFITIKQFADGLEQTRIGMYLSLASLPINVLLNYAFIFGHFGAPRMELEGAGVGTMFTRILVALVMAWIVFKGKSFKKYRSDLSAQLKLNKQYIKDVIRIGVPSSLQYGMEAGAFAVAGIIVGWLGYVQQAAHQIALSVASLTFMVSIGISMAGSIRTAYAFGKKDWQNVKEVGTSTLWIAGIYGTLCAVFFILFKNIIPYAFNDELPVVEYAALLMILAAAFQISDSVQAVGVGLLRGIQDVKIPTFYVAISYWVVGIPASLFFGFQLNMEVTGIWIGLVLGLTVSSVLQTVRFNKITNKNIKLSSKVEVEDDEPAVMV